jgi:hypothetical protein
MKKTIYLVIVIMISFALIGCRKPPKVEIIEPIESNETAFVIPLEGASKSDQGKFMSIDFLEEAKVATKRITIPVRAKKIGRHSWNIEWIPTLKVIKVNRTPVTREWTSSQDTGSSKKNQAISVESKDSIGFDVGVNITAYVTEEDAAIFLYHYSGMALISAIDQNIRGYISAALSREFGARDLQKCKSDKKEISELVLNEARKHFKKLGVTISSFGIVGGLKYDEVEIQKAINDAYSAEMKILQTKNEREAQKNINEMKVEIAIAERRAAEEFAKAQEAMIAKVGLEIKKIQAEAMKRIADKWNGSVPKNVVPQGNMFMFGLDDMKFDK